MQIISQTKKNILLHQQPLKTTTFTCFSNINEIKNQSFAKTQSAETCTVRRPSQRREAFSDDRETVKRARVRARERTKKRETKKRRALQSERVRLRVGTKKRESAAE